MRQFHPKLKTQRLRGEPLVCVCVKGWRSWTLMFRMNSLGREEADMLTSFSFPSSIWIPSLWKSVPHNRGGSLLHRHTMSVLGICPGRLSIYTHHYCNHLQISSERPVLSKFAAQSAYFPEFACWALWKFSFFTHSVKIFLL